MQRLRAAPELLDGDLADAAALTGNLRDLRRINRLLGGVTLSRAGVEALVRAGLLHGRGRVPDEPVRLLDVGTGAADVPIALLETWPQGRPMLVVTALDSRREVIAAALATTPGLERPGLELVVGDGLSLSYPDACFDVVHASLVLHHLDPEEAGRLLREMARVSRFGVVVNDLTRGWLPWAGGWLLLHLITRNRFTRHDGPLSVRRAYLPSEARALIEDAGLDVIHEARAMLGHRWSFAAVRG
jgi:ubiquinone/menaquinone biosynthesis C-methylase UbiE